MIVATLSILAIVVAIVIGTLRRVNVGLVSIGFAFGIGYFLVDLPADDIVAGWPLGLFFMLVGVTLLFGIAGSTALSELDIRVRLALRLVDREGETPVLRLLFDGVEGTPAAPIQEDHVAALFAQPVVADMLDAVEIDIVGPLLDGLAPVFFPEGDPPGRELWPSALTLLPAASEGTVDCALVIVARPERSAIPDNTGAVSRRRTAWRRRRRPRALV